MDTIGRRLAYLRKKVLGYNQTDFGKIINVSDELISLLERGQRNFTDRTISDICREFKVNEEWLRHGIGEMFEPDSDDIDYLVAKYGSDLNQTQKAILVAILKMDPKQREAVERFIDDLIALREKN